MSKVSFYHRETGLFHSHWAGPDELVEANTPPNCKPMNGHHPLYGSRVDVSTGNVVPHRPSAPSPDHIWSEEHNRHVLSEAGIHRATVDASIRRLIESQHDASREMLLGHESARERLQAIHDQIVKLRGSLTALE